MFTTSGLNLFTNFRNSISVEQMYLFNEYLALFIEYSYFLIEYLTKHKGKKKRNFVDNYETHRPAL